jgi:hypothetical protein
MKQLLILTILVLISTSLFAQTKDTTTYRFKEPDAILIDNLMGQLDQCAGNSDRISTSQYNQLHKAVMRIDSLVKKRYLELHPVKAEPKKTN